MDHFETNCARRWKGNDQETISSNSTWATTWQNQQHECAPSEDSDQPGRPPSLIRVFAVRMKKAWVLSYPPSAQRRLWSDWANAQADLSLRWAHTHVVGFVMSWLMWNSMISFPDQSLCWFCHVATHILPNTPNGKGKQTTRTASSITSIKRKAKRAALLPTHHDGH